MMIQGILGATDTIFYHEYVYNLPKYAHLAKSELALHSIRDFLYGTLYLTLPFFAWQGLFALVLAGLLLMEVVITLVDFAVEDSVRLPWGGVAKGERSMHLLIAILFGGFLALFAPHLYHWALLPTGFAEHSLTFDWLRVVLPVMGVGAILSGIRDLGAAMGLEALKFSLFPGSPVRVPKVSN